MTFINISTWNNDKKSNDWRHSSQVKDGLAKLDKKCDDKHLPKVLWRDQSVGKDMSCDSDPKERSSSRRSSREVRLDARNRLREKIRVDQKIRVMIKTLRSNYRS